LLAVPGLYEREAVMYGYSSTAVPAVALKYFTGGFASNRNVKLCPFG
jgi:hypothetical protein